jgi:hypothetical protein
MPAENEHFPWLSYYGHYNFFEARVKAHNKVENLKKVETGLYSVRLMDGRLIKVFVCECYSFGVAEYYEAVGKLGHLDAVVINSNWCGYTSEVKLACRLEKVGVFNISGFMAAMNLHEYWNYMTEEERKRLK